MAVKKTNIDTDGALSFEELMLSIESIIGRMESGELPLKESVQSFEEGMKQIRAARNMLDSYEKTVEDALNTSASKGEE